MTEPINVGFIGGGPRALSLFNSLISSEEMEEMVYPKAVLDLNPEVLKNWEYRVDSSHSTMDSFLKEDLDAIIIGTPPSTHAPLAIKCLQAGINVWSEVPMGLEMEDLWNIRDSDKGNKGNKGRYSLGENYCWQLQPQFMAMKNAQNAIGDIYYCESEYTHSVEHYMIEENYFNKVKTELDPELFPETTPTWRAGFVPIKYGHAIGSNLYVLNKNPDGIIERPIEVSAMGNMKMQKRFNTQNFQIAMIKTNKDTICKMVIGFVLGHHGRIFNSYWGSRGIFNGGSFQAKNHYYSEVPIDKGQYPDRHEIEPQILTDEDLIKMGTPTAPGGHGGSDILMFNSWIDSIFNKKPLEIDVYRSAEMTAPGILADKSIRERKLVEIPNFE